AMPISIEINEKTHPYLHKLITQAQARLEAQFIVRVRAEIQAESEAKGWDEGKAEGKLEGKLEGKAEAVVKVLERRFGPLSPVRRAEILGIDSQRLDVLLDRVFEAPNLAALFAEE
ncbi:MAG: putative transposase, partial [Rhodospirillaceae bacterium]